MNMMEKPRGKGPKTEAPIVVTPERTALAEEVYRRYHDKLIHWCKYKLLHRGVQENVEVEAENIVQDVYDILLTGTNPIDINRGKGTQVYLNIMLDHQISLFLLKRRQIKKNPKGGSVSFEEIFKNTGGENSTTRGDKKILYFSDGHIHQAPARDEEDLDPRVKKHFTEEPEEEDYSERGEFILKVPGAMEALEKIDPRGAKILRQRHEGDKTLEEIGEEMGLTRERVRQLEAEAHFKVKCFLETGHLPVYLQRKRFTQEEDDLIIELSKDEKFRSGQMVDRYKIACELGKRIYQDRFFRSPNSIFDRWWFLRSKSLVE